MIPLYIIEEHHEAFYIWNRAAAAGFLPPFGNTLLHVDHHPDFECGAYNADWNALFSSLDEMRAFTYESLGVADFICPAIYQGIFNEVVFLRDYRGGFSKPEEKLLTLDDTGCLNIENVSALTRNALTRTDCDYRLFAYSQGGLGAFYTPQPLALDIDLDYFCWDDSLSCVPDKKLEITGQAYLDVVNNPYHPFRLFPKALLRAVEEDGRFYLSYVGLPEPRPLPDKDLIRKRVDLFARWLGREKIAPCMISICRSHYSGYTPLPVWAEVENHLLRRLTEVFDYDTQG